MRGTGPTARTDDTSLSPKTNSAGLAGCGIASLTNHDLLSRVLIPAFKRQRTSWETQLSGGIRYRFRPPHIPTWTITAATPSRDQRELFIIGPDCDHSLIQQHIVSAVHQRERETLGLLGNRSHQSNESLLIHSVVVRRVADFTPFHCIANGAFGLDFNDRPGVRPELNPGGQLVGRDVREFEQGCSSLFCISSGRRTAIREQVAPLTCGSVRS